MVDLQAQAEALMPDFPTPVTGLAAGRKVLVRLKDVFDVAAAALPDEHPVAGTLFLIDRPFEQPFQEDELIAGAVSIRHVDTSRTSWDHTTLLHTGEFAFDIGTAEGEVNSIGDRGATIEAWMVGILAADITIGGLTTDAVTLSLTADEQQGAEAGILLSAARLTWLTSRTDLFTIRGPLGLIP